MDSNIDKLVLKRFCGEEYYLVDSSSYSIKDNKLLITVNFREGTNLHEDTKELMEEPSLSLSFDLSNSLEKGIVLNNPDNNDTYFYYCEYIDLSNIRLEILDIKNNQILIKLSAECTDINYYDGSKGNDSLTLTAWIDGEK